MTHSDLFPSLPPLSTQTSFPLLPPQQPTAPSKQQRQRRHPAVLRLFQHEKAQRLPRGARLRGQKPPQGPGRRGRWPRRRARARRGDRGRSRIRKGPRRRARRGRGPPPRRSGRCDRAGGQGRGRGPRGREGRGPRDGVGQGESAVGRPEQPPRRHCHRPLVRGGRGQFLLLWSSFLFHRCRCSRRVSIAAVENCNRRGPLRGARNDPLCLPGRDQEIVLRRRPPPAPGQEPGARGRGGQDTPSEFS